MAPAKSDKTRLVIDTSLFVNPEVRHALGATPTEALNNFLELARRAESLEFYMPPSIFNELMNFISRADIPAEALVYIRQKPPMRYEMMMPAGLLYELVDDMRERINKGLRIAEKGIRAARNQSPDDVIKDIRRKYRDALREGIIDSKEDVDLILLARELNAVLVSADQGAIEWAEKFGLQWLLPEKFKEYVEVFARPKAKRKKAPGKSDVTGN